MQFLYYSSHKIFVTRCSELFSRRRKVRSCRQFSKHEVINNRMKSFAQIEDVRI
jgi:hypothetical protein